MEVEGGKGDRQRRKRISVRHYCRDAMLGGAQKGSTARCHLLEASRFEWVRLLPKCNVFLRKAQKRISVKH